MYSKLTVEMQIKH